MKPKFLLLFLLFLSQAYFSQNNDNRYIPKEYVEITHPEWSKNATIYEVNVRQYTPEGTFKAFEKHLPRLKNMGIDIIWLMPIHPIGEKYRKGKLGSYYAVKDFKGVNPEFGNMQDFKHLVDEIHKLGMYVIIDWVGNHSAWDNPLAKEHPDWYTKNREGNFQPTPWYDWDDVIDFDYNHPEFRKYMTGALKFWVKEANIDGYRADVAGFIPVDFWENARKELDEIKPVFMLAEWENRDLYKKSFDMTYSWTLFDKLKDATTQNKGIGGLVEYLAHDVGSVPRNAYRMLFTDNQDMNSWNGKYGGEMVRVTNDKMDKVISFYRESNGDAVLQIFNFSNEEITVKLDTKYLQGNYTELFSKEKTALKDSYTLQLKPWEYKIWVKN